MRTKQSGRKKIAFIGAGSLGFTKKIITDLLSYPALSGSLFSLMDIDAKRLQYTKRTVQRIIQEGKYKAEVEIPMKYGVNQAVGDTTRSAVRSQTTISLSLKHGKNELLFKVDQKHGAWGFYANFAQRYPNVSVRLA